MGKKLFYGVKSYRSSVAREDEVGEVQEKAKQTADCAKDTLNDGLESAKDRVKSTKEKVQEGARSAAEKAKETGDMAKEKTKESAGEAKKQANKGKSKVSEMADSVGEKAKETAKVSWETAKDVAQKDLVKTECERWCQTGKNIKYETRNNRHGYKAGALKEGMKHNYTESCDYVAIFDADFQPASDFLMRALPYLIHNPEIALVQARWKFVNANDCLMTRVQEMSMDYHFKVEQESGSSGAAFFGFNGTAGVWRISAIKEAGGWKERTTVEDMDLAVRASLGGWKFLYVGNIQVKSELPSTFKAYRHQQHRWACGPANLFRKMLADIVHSKKVSLWRKGHVIYNFFIARRIISHCVTFFFYCVVIPLSVFFEEVEVPKWAVVYVPTIITLLNSVGTPSSFHLILFWILFENVVSLHRCKAVFIGLLEVSSVNDWVVTEKLGDMLKTKPTINIRRKIQMKLWERFHFWEVALGVYLFICACYDYSYCKDRYYLYIFPQSISFFIMGFGYVGTRPYSE